MDAELAIGYRLSSRGRQYVDAQRSKLVKRQRRLTCDSRRLLELLAQSRIEVTTAAVDFEENLGGWGYERADSEFCLGVFCSVYDGEMPNAVATRFRRMGWLFERAREQVSVDGEVSPIWGTGYPRVFFQERPLVPAGMHGSELLYFLGSGGEIYVYQRETDVLLLVAGSARAMLERDAFAALTPGWDEWYRVHVCADAAELVSTYLGVAVSEPCSDALFRVWANEEAQIVSVPNWAPCIGGTVVSTRHSGDLLRVLRKLAGSDPSKPLYCWERANNLRDARGLSMLSEEGLNLRLLDGAAPGHFDRIVDGETGDVTNQPSKYDPSTLYQVIEPSA